MHGPLLAPAGCAASRNNLKHKQGEKLQKDAVFAILLNAHQMPLLPSDMSTNGLMNQLRAMTKV